MGGWEDKRKKEREKGRKESKKVKYLWKLGNLAVRKQIQKMISGRNKLVDVKKRERKEERKKEGQQEGRGEKRKLN